MNRREVITVLGGATAWPLAVGAQQQPAMPVIGFLHQGGAEPNNGFVVKFRQSLRESSYVDGQNVTTEFRWAEGHYDRLPALAADLARRQVTVMVAAYRPAALAAKSATARIPIVFVSGSDPVETGLVTSINRPGGNVTGVNLFSGMLASKRLELLRELVPKADLVAVLVNPTNTNAETNMKDLQSAALGVRQRIQVLSAGSDLDLETAFATLAQSRPGALFVSPDTFLQDHRDQLLTWAAHHRVPTIYYERVFVDAGGLISYGPDQYDGFAWAGVYTGRILKGQKPADLPIMQPTKFELVINLKTAKTLGVDVPASLLARADEVIE
jgi:putative tryptophan/tyrosine transport system substrate-binding protein